MILAGIDFSINSTSVCILSDKGYSWHHFGREKASYLKFNSGSYNQMLFPPRKKGDDYCQTERMKIGDADALCKSIIAVLQENGVEKVAFEGHSFNSKGNSLLELVSYQFLLRNMINMVMKISLENMYFYSPISIKSFAGGAKFKKKDLLEKFILCDDPLLSKNSLYQEVVGLGDLCFKKDEVIKPLDDLVDSYWIVKKLSMDV